MAVTYVGRSASIVNGNAGQTPALPAGLQVDDILVLALETANQAITVSNPNGGTWTEVTNSPQSQGTPAAAGGVRLTVFWSRYNGTQGAPSTSDSGDHQTACIFAFRGCATVGDPWDFTAGNTQAATTSGSVPGGTTTVDGCMILNLVATDRDLASTTTASGHANASLTNLTERADQTFSGAAGGGLIAFTGEKATAGTVNATTWTQAASEELCNLTIALSPGLPPVTGTLASTQADQTAAFAGAEAMTGTMASTQADQTAALSGTVVNAVTGTLAATQADQSAAFAGLETITGTLDATQRPQSAESGYVRFFGGGPGAIATPDDAAYDVLTGDLQIIFGAAMYHTTGKATHDNIIAKGDPSSAGVGSFVLRKNNATRTLTLSWRESGGTVRSVSVTSAFPNVIGQFRHYKAEFDASTATMTVYQSDQPRGTPTADLTWALHGSDTDAVSTSIAVGSAPIWLGGRSDLPNEWFDGELAYVELRDGIGGTVILSPDFRDDDQLTTPNTVFTDPQGRVWTISDPAVWVPEAGFVGLESMLGTMASSQADQQGALTGTVLNPIAGTLAATQDDQTADLVGLESMLGSIAATQADDTAALAGTVTNPITGALAATQDDQQAALTGAELMTGALAAQQADQTAALTGVVASPVTGALDATQDDQTANLVAEQSIPGALASSQADQLGAFAGLVAVPVTGTLSATQADDTAALAGSIGTPAVTGTLAATQDDQTADLVGLESITGTLAAIAGADTAALTGLVLTGITGALSSQAANQVAVFAGLVVNPAAALVAPLGVQLTDRSRNGALEDRSREVVLTDRAPSGKLT